MVRARVGAVALQPQAHLQADGGDLKPSQSPVMKSHLQADPSISAITLHRRTGRRPLRLGPDCTGRPLRLGRRLLADRLFAAARRPHRRT
eukprot:3383892-Prymnesium_polylepis.1